MQPSGNPDKSSSVIVNVVLIMIGLPLFMAIWGNLSTPAHEESSEPVFDTLQITGYSYFRARGIVITPESDTSLFGAVYRHIGIPHISRAGSRGLDCSGLVRRIFNQVYDIRLRGGSNDIYRGATTIPPGELREADLVFFKIGSNRINHVGIYLQNGKFVHSSTSSGVVINDLSEPYYKRYFYGATRVNTDR